MRENKRMKKKPKIDKKEEDEHKKGKEEKEEEEAIRGCIRDNFNGKKRETKAKRKKQERCTGTSLSKMVVPHFLQIFSPFWRDYILEG